MAENSTLDNEAIDDLYLTNGISENTLKLWVDMVTTGSFNMLGPLLIITVLYTCCKSVIKMHVKECRYCTNLTSTGIVCKKSKSKKVRFCRYIERWTIWLLVDLFRTPNVEKQVKNKDVIVKVLKKRSLVVGEKVSGSTWIFYCISFIFSIYIKKFLVDFFLKLTPTCIDEGDFGIPAACYALDTNSSSPLATQISYQINCTTWNDNLESLGEEIGLLFCFSFYYNVLTSVIEIIGMFGLQTVVVQLTLTLLEKCKLPENVCLVIILS